MARKAKPRPEYTSVPAQVDLPALDHEVLDFWRDNRVFERTLSRGGPEWVFYEGPPTANGMPGAHHIEARVFKDVFPRHRTMKGFHVERKAGWDCHGLPVELAVERGSASPASATSRHTASPSSTNGVGSRLGGTRTRSPN